jgi:hypothetical protein
MVELVLRPFHKEKKIEGPTEGMNTVDFEYD